MKIERIEIDGFGCHKGLSLSFREDFNLLCGKNESGKSTVLSFIETMLYGFEEGDRNFWRPWNGGAFGGTLIFTQNGISYKVMVSWGITPEEDRITVTNAQTGAEMPLQKGETVGLTFLNYTRESFRLFARGIAVTGQEDAEIRQLDALTQGVDVNRTETEETKQLSKFKDKLTEDMRGLDTRKGILLERHEKRVQSEREVQKLEARIHQTEQQRETLSTKETNAQKMDLFTASVALLEKQKKVERLCESIDILQAEYATLKETTVHKKRPWTILLIILLVLDILTLTALFMPAKWLPTFLPLSELSTGAHLATCFTAGGLFLVFSLALILVRTGGRSGWIEAEDALAFKEQALWDLLDLKQPSGEEVEVAILSLSDRCKGAAQRIASIEKERQDQADLTAKNIVLEQKITYDRAQLEILHRFMQGEATSAELEIEMQKIDVQKARLQKHIAAADAGIALLQLAQNRQCSDLGPRLSGQTGTYLGSFTAGRYDTVELSPVLEPQVRVGNVVRSCKHYSSATEKQLNLSVKLAEIKLLADSGQKFPLILDEPMAVYDEERRSASLETLLRFAKENDIQIILTSSQTKAPYVAEYSQYALSI